MGPIQPITRRPGTDRVHSQWAETHPQSSSFVSDTKLREMNFLEKGSFSFVNQAFRGPKSRTKGSGKMRIAKDGKSMIYAERNEIGEEKKKSKTLPNTIETLLQTANRLN